MGDIQLGTRYPDESTLPTFPPVELFANVSPYFDGSDVVFGNLEGALTDDVSTVKRCNNPAVCFTFGMPTAYAKDLKSAGFTLMSIANNHVNDFGPAGKNQTVNALKDNDIHFAGLIESPIDVFTVNGIRYGFCAFAPNMGMSDIREIDAARRIVRKTREMSDIVIVSFHGGGEGANHQHVTRQTEQFLGENRGNVYQFAHAMIDEGADVLLGHGPHVTRAIEVYKDRFIAYSMGNFNTFANININGVNGLAPLFNILMQKDGAFIKAQVISTQQTRGQPVQIDADKQVFGIIKKLTFSDFPEMNGKLEFTEDGVIRLVK
jgi:poly-gamma-glutamate capsule biosynthesis protein CapA/YwtB (metallophosphatase superfamily)